MAVTPPLLRRANNPDKGVAGRKAEKLLADRTGGRLTPGSGALKGAKGDVSLESMLIENKSSQSASFTLKQDHLLKVYQEALEQGKHPAFAFQFVNSRGTSQKKDRWIMVPEHVLLELIGN